MLLRTIRVKVIRPDGRVTLQERRILRIVKPGGSLTGRMCIARHKKAILVIRIVDHETVEVDMKAERIPLSDTRVCTPADITGGIMTSAAA